MTDELHHRVKELESDDTLTLSDRQELKTMKHNLTLIDQHKAFTELIKENEDMLEYWYPQINPKITGMEDLKKAVLLSIVSHEDKHGDRGRLHVLLKGDPGTGKTMITSWVIFQLGAIGASMRSSKVGLTADASGNEITLGALPRANGGICCIDELDKVSPTDRAGLLEAMEEGQIHIDVGKIHTIVEARCRVIACANDVSKFAPELLDRFDFTFELTKPTKEDTKPIVKNSMLNWFREKNSMYGVDLKGYLQWVKNFEPSISEEVRVKISKGIQLFVDLHDKTEGIRSYESLIRIPFAIAKLNHRDVQTSDFIKAIEMKHPEFNNGKIEALKTLLER